MRRSNVGSGILLCCLWLLCGLQAVQAATGQPVILQQPQSQTAFSGSNVTFTVTADGTAPFRYQWRFNNLNIPGATNASLILPSISFTQSGVYTVFIYNALGSAFSDAALLQVDPHLTFRITALRTNGALVVNHSALTGTDRPGLAVSASSVFINGGTTSARYDSEYLTGGMGLGRRYEGLVADLRTERVYAMASGTNLLGSAGGPVNTLYEIDGVTGALTTNTIVLSTNIPAQNFGDVGIFSGYGRIVIHIGYRAYHIEMPSGKVTDLGSAYYLNHQYSSSWAYWGIAEYLGGRIHLVYPQYGFPNVTNIIRTRIPDYAPSSVAAEFTNLRDLASITFSPSLSRWFFHYQGIGQMGGFSQTLGSAKGLYTTDYRFPIVLSDPQYQSAYPGSNALFSVQAYSELPISYQWQFGGTNIAGATNSVLMLTNVSLSDEGLYSVIVSNSVGAALSGAGQLALVTSPVIYQSPSSRSVYPGANVILYGFADGAPPLTYQWYYNGQEIGDATNDTLVLTNVQPIQAGAYSFSVSNRYDMAFSDSGILTVVAEPIILAPPIERSVNVGGTASFAVTADGAPPLRYQWQFNGTNLVFATNRTLTITNAQPSMNGTYTVIVSNLYGTANASAPLHVITIPSIVTDPLGQAGVQGEALSLSVTALGPGPLYYQWRLNGTNLVGQTNQTFEILNFQASHAGSYSVLVYNSYGAALSAPAVVTLFPVYPEGSAFRIAALTGNDSRVLDHNSLTGDDRGGLALSLDSVFVTGDNATAKFDLGLTNGVSTGTRLDGLVSNLRNGKIYLLASNQVPIVYGNGYQLINRLLEVDGKTGQTSGKEIPLSQPIPVYLNSSQNGVFSGFDRVMLHNNTNIYHISLSSGVVSNLGALTISQRRSSESWAYWGVAENWGGSLYVVYARNSTTISRTRVPDGQTTTLATFSSIGETASFSVAPYANRWYFHYEGGAQFGGSDETVGYASAVFDVNPVGSFVWEPLAPVQLVDTPFTVTITAKTPLNEIATTYNGPATLAGTNVVGGGLVAIVPTVTGNFTNGVWSGQVRILQPSPGMRLQVANTFGNVGLSESFQVLPANDVSVAVFESSDPVAAATPLTYTIQVTNTGPALATGMVLTNQLSTNLLLQSVSASQGACSNNAGVIYCSLGSIAGREAAFVTVDVTPLVPGLVTNRVWIGRGEADANLTNNTVVTVTTSTLPFITIQDATLVEGDSGTNTMLFNLSLHPPATNNVRVNFITSSSSAVSGSDFVFRSGSITFTPGQTNQTISVSILGDDIYESDESLSVLLSIPFGGFIARNIAVGTIVNDDPIPTLSVGDASMLEGNSGTNALEFSVQLSGRSGLPVTLRYATSDGTAKAAQDYLARSGSLTFDPNATVLTQTVQVPIVGDTFSESNETFFLNIFSVSNALVNQTRAVGTILGDDGAGVLHHFSISLSGTQQTVNVPAAVSIAARDFFDAPITNFQDAVKLQAGIGTQPEFKTMLGDPVHQDSFAGDYTLGYQFMPSQDITVTAVRHYAGTKISVWTSGGALVFSVPVVSIFGVWQETPLAEPVTLSGGESYRIAYYSGGSEGLNPYGGSGIPNTFQDGVITNVFYESGDSFPVNDISSGYFFSDLVYYTGLSLQPIASMPTNTASFINGSWSGEVTFLESGAGVKLFASDKAGHRGETAPFNIVGTGNVNLGLQALTATNAAPVGSNLVLSLIVTNRGPGMASGVIISNLLPSGFQFISADLPPGASSNAANQVWLRFDNIPSQSAASVAITVLPTATGVFTNLASVSCDQNDPAPWNNTAALGVTIFRDSDGDGMWDDWEQAYRLNRFDASDATMDPDQDGFNNLREFLAGTHPEQAQSVLRISQVRMTNGQVHISFRGVTGRKYRLERHALSAGSWQSIFEFKVGLSEDVNLVDSPGATGAIYRVRLMQ